VGQARTIGLDIAAKRVCQAHGAAASGPAVFRKRLVRAKPAILIGRLAALASPCELGLDVGRRF